MTNHAVIMMETKNNEYCATIGVFDGVHRGHRKVIEKMKAIAQQHGLKTMVVTFDALPAEVISPTNAPKPLMTLQEKVDCLRSLGVDHVEVLHFDKEFMQTTAYEFMEKTLYGLLGVRILLTGYDNRFGKRNTDESFETYVCYGKEIGVDVVLGPKPEECGLFEGKPVSSSLIRKLIDEGRTETAMQLMG